MCDEPTSVSKHAFSRARGTRGIEPPGCRERVIQNIRPGLEGLGRLLLPGDVVSFRPADGAVFRLLRRLKDVLFQLR